MLDPRNLRIIALSSAAMLYLGTVIGSLAAYNAPHKTVENTVPAVLPQDGSGFEHVVCSVSLDKQVIFEAVAVDDAAEGQQNLYTYEHIENRETKKRDDVVQESLIQTVSLSDANAGDTINFEAESQCRSIFSYASQVATRHRVSSAYNTSVYFRHMNDLSAASPTVKSTMMQRPQP